MITFKKYSSIENSFTADFMEKVRQEIPADLEWVVQEKVHGANVSFICDGERVAFAKRTSLVEEDEKFYDYRPLLDRYTPVVLSLYRMVKERYPDMKSMSLFGEMFGGKYPHKDVAPVKNTVLIQKGVYYSPVNEFYAFDIYVAEEDGGRYLSLDEVNGLFEAAGLFYARTLFRGTLDEALAYPNAFQSTISRLLGFPDIGDNICEGVVIRPVTPQFLNNGSRVLIKNKNERFAEKKGVKKRVKQYSEPVPYSEALKDLVTEIDAYVTDNRYANVLSHIGDVSFPKDFGKVMGLFAKDILDDFLKEHGSAYSALEKSEQKLLTRELNRLATTFVKIRARG